MDHYTQCINDIALAQLALDQSQLTRCVASRPLLCDVYCIPSHNNQAFYMQVYGGNEYTLLFAKPLVSDYYGRKIVMYTFHDTLQTNNHKAKTGSIYCGIKQLPLNDSVIVRLLRCLPSNAETCKDFVSRIDGVYTLIRNLQNNEQVPLGYSDSRQIRLNTVSPDDTTFLNFLYLHIEELIGNLNHDHGEFRCHLPCDLR